MQLASIVISYIFAAIFKNLHLHALRIIDCKKSDLSILLTVFGALWYTGYKNFKDFVKVG